MKISDLKQRAGKWLRRAMDEACQGNRGEADKWYDAAQQANAAIEEARGKVAPSEDTMRKAREAWLDTRLTRL